MNLSKLSEWPKFKRHEALRSALRNSVVLPHEKTLIVGYAFTGR